MKRPKEGGLYYLNLKLCRALSLQLSPLYSLNSSLPAALFKNVFQTQTSSIQISHVLNRLPNCMKEPWLDIKSNYLLHTNYSLGVINKKTPMFLVTLILCYLYKNSKHTDKPQIRRGGSLTAWNISLNKTEHAEEQPVIHTFISDWLLQDKHTWW